MPSDLTERFTMTRERPAHIEPSRDSTEEVDGLLRHVDGRVDVTQGAGSPAIEPNTDTPINAGT